MAYVYDDKLKKTVYGRQETPHPIANRIKALSLKKTWIGDGYEEGLTTYMHAMQPEYVPNIAERVPDAPTCTGDVIDSDTGLPSNPYPFDQLNCSTVVKLKTTRKFSDGYPVTAYDFAYYWDLHQKYPSHIQSPPLPDTTVDITDTHEFKVSWTNQARPTGFESLTLLSLSPIPKHFWSQYDASWETLTSDDIIDSPVTGHIVLDMEKTIWSTTESLPERLVYKVNSSLPSYVERYWTVCWDTMGMIVESDGMTHTVGAGCNGQRRVKEGPYVNYIAITRTEEDGERIALFNADHLHSIGPAFWRQGIGPDNNPFGGSIYDEWKFNYAYNVDHLEKHIQGSFKLWTSSSFMTQLYGGDFNLRTWPTKSLAFRNAVVCLVDKKRQGFAPDRGHFKNDMTFGSKGGSQSDTIPMYAEKLCFDKNEKERQQIAIDMLKDEGWTADDWGEQSLKGLERAASWEPALDWGIQPPRGLTAPDGTPANDFANEIYVWNVNENRQVGDRLVDIFNNLGVPTRAVRVTDNNALPTTAGFCGNYSSWPEELKRLYIKLPMWSMQVYNKLDRPNYFNQWTNVSDHSGYGSGLNFGDLCAKKPFQVGLPEFGPTYGGNPGFLNQTMDALNDYFRVYGNWKRDAAKHLKRIMIANDAVLRVNFFSTPNTGHLVRNVLLPDMAWEANVGNYDYMVRFLKITNSFGKEWRYQKPDVDPVVFAPREYDIAFSPPPFPPPSPPFPPPSTPPPSSPPSTPTPPSVSSPSVSPPPQALFISNQLGGNRKVRKGKYTMTTDGGTTLTMTFDDVKVTFLWTDGNVYDWPYVTSGQCPGTYSWRNRCNAHFTLTFPVTTCTNTMEYISGCATFGNDPITKFVAI